MGPTSYHVENYQSKEGFGGNGIPQLTFRHRYKHVDEKNTNPPPNKYDIKEKSNSP